MILWLAESFATCSELAKEEEANAVLYRNTFGTQPKRALGPLQNAFDLYLKNPANTNVVLWGNRLLALWEVNKRTTIQCSYFISFCLTAMTFLLYNDIAAIGSMSVACMGPLSLFISLHSLL